MNTSTDHTCDAEYDEPCIACAIARGLKLRQFGYALMTSAFAKRGPTRIEEDDEELDADVSSDIAETRAHLEEVKRDKERAQRLRAQNKARQTAGKHSLRMTH